MYFMNMINIMNTINIINTSNIINIIILYIINNFFNF